MSSPSSKPDERIIHVDGSSLNNQSSGGRRAGIAVYFGPNDPRNISVPVEGDKHTNNVAEMQAVIAALEACDPAVPHTIVTDSQLVVKGLVGMDGNRPWVEAWARNGWKTAKRQPVQNKDLWTRMMAIAKTRNFRLRWQRGHAGHAGNEAADALAKSGARLAKRFIKK